MRIYFLTREPDVCQLMADKFSSLHAEIRIFPLVTKLFQNIFDFGITPDILFLDFLYYQNDVYDFYNLLKRKNKMFPVVYYNHPFPIPERRKFFWSFNLQKTGYFPDISKIEPLLQIMEEALKDPDIYPYVTAIQQPLPYRSTNLRYIEPIKESEIKFYTENFDNVITDSIINTKKLSSSRKTEIPQVSPCSSFTNEFRNRNHMSHKIFRLFSYLYSKRNSHVSIDELKKILSSGTTEESSNGIRLAVYRLRSILKNDKQTSMQIVNYDYGYSLIENTKV